MPKDNEKDLLTKVRLSKPFFYPRNNVLEHPYCIFGIAKSILHQNFRYFAKNEMESCCGSCSDNNLIHKDINLQETIFNFNIEGMCEMLLNNDDNLVSLDSSLFTYAIRINNFEAAGILLDYFDEFSSETFRIALHNLLYVEEPEDDKTCAQLFRDVWAKSDHSCLLTSYLSFLHTFLCICNYSNSEWIECFYVVMESPYATDLVLHYADTVATSFGYLEHTFCTFTNRNIGTSDRLRILYALLTFGMPVELQDITTAYQMYGYSEELLALIYSADICILSDKYELNVNSYSLPCAIVGLDFSFDKSTILEMHCNQIINNINLKRGDNTSQLFFCKSLRYFSFFCNAKQELLEVIREHRCDSLVEKELLESPSFPSLLELCRKPARIFIKKKFSVIKPYQFHDAVKNLNLPSIIKDILLYKKPLY